LSAGLARERADPLPERAEIVSADCYVIARY